MTMVPVFLKVGDPKKCGLVINHGVLECSKCEEHGTFVGAFYKKVIGLLENWLLLW